MGIDAMLGLKNDYQRLSQWGAFVGPTDIRPLAAIFSKLSLSTMDQAVEGSL